MIGTLLGNVCCTLFIVFRDYYWNIVNGSFLLKDFKQIVSLTIISVILNGFLVLFPFIIGMIKKSISATIVGSIIMAVFLQIVFTQTESSFELVLSGSTIVLILLLISGIMYATSIKKINATE